MTPVTQFRALQVPRPDKSSQEVFDKLESRVRSYARSFGAVFNRAEGARIFDEHGRAYLDFLSGAGSLNYGHNHPLLRDALVQYITGNGIAHSLDLHTVAKASFLDALDTRILQPRALDYVAQFTGPTGANAVEAALKLARKVTGRRNVVSFTNGFHGVTLGALAATGNSHHRGAAGIDMGGVTRMPFDGYLGPQVERRDRGLQPRAGGHGARRAARPGRGVPGALPDPSQDNCAVFHRQDAQQLPAYGPYPPDAAQCQDHRHPPPPDGLLFFQLQAALRPGPELQLQPGGHGSLLP